MRQRLLHGEDRAADVRFERRGEVLPGDVLDGGEFTTAGIREHDVQARAALADRAEHPVEVIRSCDVRAHGRPGIAELGLHRGELVRGASGHHDVRAFVHEAPNDGQSDSRGSAGDECGPAVELSHDSSHLYLYRSVRYEEKNRMGAMSIPYLSVNISGSERNDQGADGCDTPVSDRDDVDAADDRGISRTERPPEGTGVLADVVDAVLREDEIRWRAVEQGRSLPLEFRPPDTGALGVGEDDVIRVDRVDRRPTRLGVAVVEDLVEVGGQEFGDGCHGVPFVTDASGSLPSMIAHLWRGRATVLTSRTAAPPADARGDRRRPRGALRAPDRAADESGARR